MDKKGRSIRYGMGLDSPRDLETREKVKEEDLILYFVILFSGSIFNRDRIYFGVLSNFIPS